MEERIPLITRSGWYRLAERGRGWVRVPDDEAERLIAGGAGYDLVRYDLDQDVTEEPLF